MNISKFHPWIQPAAQKYDAELWKEFHRCKDRARCLENEKPTKHSKIVTEYLEAKDKLVNWYG